MALSSYFDIDVYSHHFKLSAVQTRGRELADNFARSYIDYGWEKRGKKMVRVPSRVYAAMVREGSEYRFHIGQLDTFFSFLSVMGIPNNSYKLVFHKPSPGVDVDIKITDSITPRDYQVDINEYIISDKPSIRKLVEIQTGKGKSYIAAKAGSDIHKRIAMFIRPSFIKKWIEDFEKYYGITGDDIAVIQGSAQLMQLLALAKENKLKAKVIIFSNRTFQNWIKLYERKSYYTLDMGYDCLLPDYCEFLGIGYRIIDEVHLDFHLNFKIDLYTNVAKAVSLSATMISDSSFTNKMYEIAYPKSERFAGLAYDKYVKSYSYIYSVKSPNRLKTHEWGSLNYSHNAFEDSILKNPLLLKDYYTLITDCLEEIHLKRFKPGEKALIYCASVAMCTNLAQYLKRKYTHLNINRYVGTEDDPYENLLESDISISTLQSAGTGHDIAGLISVIMTIALKSTQSNIQGFGRLRNLQGKEMRFAYFVCRDVAKHVDYHEKKKEILKDISVDYRIINYPLILGP